MVSGHRCHKFGHRRAFAEVTPHCPGPTCISPVAFKVVLYLCLAPPPPGIRGQVRTVIFHGKSMIWDRFLTGSGGYSNLNLHFDLQYSWGTNQEHLYGNGPSMP